MAPASPLRDRGPLAGLLVVAVEQAVAAPYCSSRLADAGARVIKVERPEGDFARGYDRAAAGEASYFVWLNRGKESIALDFRRPDDKALLAAMIARADVFIQNLAPGAMARAGFASGDLRARHPGLVTVDISGYGEEGAYARMKAYDLLVQAESGLASITGHPAGPGRVGVSVCDIACGMNAHAAVLEALIARGRTGQGAGIAVSLFDALADWMTVPLLQYEASGRPPERVGLAHPSICPYGAFPTADGSLVLIAVQNEREWAALCAGFIGEPALATRPGFSSNVQRVDNRAAVDAVVAAAVLRRSREDCAADLGRAGIAFGFVNDMAAFAAHPALRRAEVATPRGRVAVAAPAARRAGSPLRLGAVPALDEHGARLRREFAADAAG